MSARTYHLSLARTYVSRWGLAEAVREFIQNAIDVGGPAYYHSVSSSSSYRAEPRSHFEPELPVTILKRWLSEHRKNMRGAAIEAFRKELIEGAAQNWRSSK